MSSLWIDDSQTRGQNPRRAARLILGNIGASPSDQDLIEKLDELARHSEAAFREGGDYFLRGATRLGDPERLALLLDYRFEVVPNGRSPWSLDTLLGLRLVTVTQGDPELKHPLLRIPEDFSCKSCMAELVFGAGSPVACLDVLVDRRGIEPLQIPVQSFPADPRPDHVQMGYQTLLMMALHEGKHALAAHILKLDPEALDDRTSRGYTLDELIDKRELRTGRRWFDLGAVTLVRAAQAARYARTLIAPMMQSRVSGHSLSPGLAVSP